jgi:hypothetical protein
MSDRHGSAGAAGMLCDQLESAMQGALHMSTCASCAGMLGPDSSIIP